MYDVRMAQFVLKIEKFSHIIGARGSQDLRSPSPITAPVPDRIVAGLVGVFRNGGDLGTGESYIPVVFFDPLRHRSPCFPDVDFAALTGNSVDNTILFSRVDGVVWSH